MDVCRGLGVVVLEVVRLFNLNGLGVHVHGREHLVSAIDMVILLFEFALGDCIDFDTDHLRLHSILFS